MLTLVGLLARVLALPLVIELAVAVRLALVRRLPVVGSVLALRLTGGATAPATTTTPTPVAVRLVSTLVGRVRRDDTHHIVHRLRGVRDLTVDVVVATA